MRSPRTPAMHISPKALFWASVITVVLAVLIVLGSRNLRHFDAALVGYTFATLFATFGISYRYCVWLQRPPTKMYWRRGWQVFLNPLNLGRNLLQFARRFFVEFLLNSFILRRGKLRWGAHWLIMIGCIMAAAITFPLVWGWIHFQTVTDAAGRLVGEDIGGWYRVYVFGFPTISFPVESPMAFFTFHGLVWSSWLVIAGVMLAFRRRMIDHGAAAVQQFGEDMMPLLLLFAISVTGLMLTASYTWMKGYAFDFLAILHAITVIFTLLWLPFGKFFHIFQRPAQLGAAFYKDTNRDPATPKARCARCGGEYMSVMWRDDLIQVQRELGFRYEMSIPGDKEAIRQEAGETRIPGEPENMATSPSSLRASAPACLSAPHYQHVCPKCRRALYGLAQGAQWSRPEPQQPA